MASAGNGGVRPAVEVKVFLGLGSSLGIRERHLQFALDELNATEGVQFLRVSPIYESPHLGLKPGDSEKYPAHLNLVIEIATSLSPETLLKRIQSIEDKSGRERSERWGPRTLDIDILTYEEVTLQTHRLTLPHPGIFDRLFVILPLLALEPNFRMKDGSLLSSRIEDKIIGNQDIRVVNIQLVPSDLENKISKARYE